MTFEYDPDVQFVQADDLARLNEPSVQRIHVCDAFAARGAENVPAAQSTQADCENAEVYDPRPQDTHAVYVEYVPGMHSWHVEVPAATAAVPGEHWVHAV